VSLNLYRCGSGIGPTRGNVSVTCPYVGLTQYPKMLRALSIVRGGTQKFPELLKKLFKVFVQVRVFGPLRSTPPTTGCSNPSTAPNAGNIV
jgi:hypothetical protein